jgi:hypothetical protein
MANCHLCGKKAGFMATICEECIQAAGSLHEAEKLSKRLHSDPVLPESSQESAGVANEQPVTASEMRSFMRNLIQMQADQIKLLRNIRWSVAALAIWFVTVYWIIPKFFSTN